MGFYKKDNKQILESENFVSTPNFSMTKETKDEFVYPIEGWYWFDTFDEALVFFAGLKNSDSITPLQAKLQLLKLGLLDEVEALVTGDRTAQLYWEYASVVERDNEILLSVANSLGLTSEQVDEMFIEASKL